MLEHNPVARPLRRGSWGKVLAALADPFVRIFPALSYETTPKGCFDLLLACLKKLWKSIQLKNAF